MLLTTVAMLVLTCQGFEFDRKVELDPVPWIHITGDEAFRRRNAARRLATWLETNAWRFDHGSDPQYLAAVNYTAKYQQVYHLLALAKADPVEYHRIMCADWLRLLLGEEDFFCGRLPVGLPCEPPPEAEPEPEPDTDG